MKKNRYFIKDESFDNIPLYDREVPQDWKVDNDGDVIYECSSIYEWVESITENLQVAIDYEDYEDYNTALTSILVDLIENKNVSINAFTYYYEEVE